MQATINAVRAFFQVQPRFNYRRLLGAGGEGAAFKMTYQARNPNLPNIDFVLKTEKNGPNFSADIRKEARMMEKVKRAAHCVQIIHSSGPARGFEEPNADDSSDDPDADSSGDESVDGPPPPKPRRKDRRAPARRQKHAAHDQRYQRWETRNDTRNARVDAINEATGAVPPQPIPPEDPNNPDAGLEINRRDFIFMEYLPFGDLEQVIFRIVNDDANVLIPNEILWSFWLCTGLDIGAHDASQMLLEDLPPPRKRWRNQRIVHFDIDAKNIFLGPAVYPYRVRADGNSAALAPNLVPAGGEPVIPPEFDINMQNSVGEYNEPTEHDLIPALKEQFCPDWDYLPQGRDGDDVAQEPVAGNYDSHTNIWQMALVMWQLITYCVPPRPPRLVTSEIIRRRQHQSYALTLDDARYSEVDRELRQTIVNCLKHDPKDRPKLDFLLDQAKRAVGRRRRDATDGEIRGGCNRADKDRYEEDLRIENYIFNVYRVTGDKPKAAKVKADGINVDGTPRTRTDATAAPVRQGIAGRVGFAREPAISPEDNPSAATRHKRALALATTRRHFDLPPRYRYRTLLGRGGQGIALKMTYTPPNNPDAAKDFVLKTGGTLRYNTELRHEARMMEKVKRSAHAVQILHSSGPAFHEEVDPNDSSDDALSSDDEGASRRPQPPPSPEEKEKAHRRRWKNWEAKLRLRERRYERILKARSAGQNPPPEDPNNPDAQLDIDRFDFIFMEYMPLGSLMDTLYRMADQRAKDPNGPPIPDKVLWSFWLCSKRPS
ncbi:hypothetical protein PG985_003301 [Apiospora marii]|uniref:uncharacterized protein n=1 Tax=Apiospora marii TaxID=335849 RepID=UPI0031323629